MHAAWTRAARAFAIDAMLLSPDGHARWMTCDHRVCLVSPRPLGPPDTFVRFTDAPLPPPDKAARRVLPAKDVVVGAAVAVPCDFFASILSASAAAAFVLVAADGGCDVVGDGASVAHVVGLAPEAPLRVLRGRFVELADACAGAASVALSIDPCGGVVVDDEVAVYFAWEWE